MGEGLSIDSAVVTKGVRKPVSRKRKHCLHHRVDLLPSQSADGIRRSFPPVFRHRSRPTRGVCPAIGHRTTGTSTEVSSHAVPQEPAWDTFFLRKTRAHTGAPALFATSAEACDNR